eukprot:767364-Hanusia_phi.AAC.1
MICQSCFLPPGHISRDSSKRAFRVRKEPDKKTNSLLASQGQFHASEAPGPVSLLPGEPGPRRRSPNLPWSAIGDEEQGAQTMRRIGDGGRRLEAGGRRQEAGGRRQESYDQMK